MHQGVQLSTLRALSCPHSPASGRVGTESPLSPLFAPLPSPAVQETVCGRAPMKAKSIELGPSFSSSHCSDSAAGARRSTTWAAGAGCAGNNVRRQTNPASHWLCALRICCNKAGALHQGARQGAVGPQRSPDGPTWPCLLPHTHLAGHPRLVPVLPCHRHAALVLVKSVQDAVRRERLCAKPVHTHSN